MDAKRWERVQAICLAAAQRLDDARGAYLDEACAGDAELREEVEGILRAMEAPQAFLDEPIVRLTGLEPEAADGAPSSRIGPYEVVRPLGRGGMGEVVLAVRDHGDFRQSVAVKVIRRGMDTDDVLARFRLERQILATLRHPNIAQLLDGGVTEDGSPYFVMEYVEGVPIDEHCDAGGLSTPERLELFLVVCDAVQHAHQNLVVHRDLKPSNILVGSDGVPKLLDFGIGKLLEPGADAAPHTRTALRLLTPQYAAPEQVRGAAVTVATDVHGLGVLLYELLTGCHPYHVDELTREELEHAVCETEPARPSSRAEEAASRRTGDRGGRAATATRSERRSPTAHHLRRQLTGDLDTIVLKALRKEPERRYPSVAALADDIRRHLDGLPIAARPDTMPYRVGKFVRRNAWQVAAVVAAFLGLGATTAVTLVQSGRVADERNRALAERDRALDVRSFLLETFGGTAADQGVGDTLTVRELLDRQAANLDALYADDPVLRAEMMEVLADAYDRLTILDEAERLGREALALRREALAEGDPDIARSATLLGWILTERAEYDEAKPLLEEAVAIRRAAGDAYRLELSRSLNDLGILMERLAERDSAKALYAEAFAIRTGELGDEHRSVGITANNLAVAFYHLRQVDSAVVYAERSVRALRLALGEDHQRSILAQMNLATMRAAAGDLEGAEAEHRELLERQRRLQGPDHPLVANILNNLGRTLVEQSRYEEAEVTLRESLVLREALFGADDFSVVGSLRTLAEVLARQGRFQEAVVHQARALAIEEGQLGPTHQQVGTRRRELADWQAQAGDTAAAVASYGAAASVFAEALPETDPETVEALRSLGALLLAQGRAAEAAAAFADAHARALGLEGRGLERLTRLDLAEALLASGAPERADSLLIAAEEDGGLVGPAAERLASLRGRLSARGPAR